ncbi:hypothetical protein KDW_22500 [Dictyobacter vulcani]|uniref:Uncharacterized protein n=1 Tax=Dictyobacter vulcani TaxID=2607529 RepID=A0A5J4KFA6_9CHLR|nr:hypothetical protein [Dictyobacter vulcani]GER88088.1 hypothetical protein KDW_22500 [Dictyobacter vulcani]
MRVHSAWFMLGSLVVIAVASIAFLFYEASIDSDAAPWLVLGNHVLLSLLVRSRFGIIWLFRFILIFVAFVL